MARPRKATDEELINVVRRFYETDAHGNTKLLKPAKLEAYSRQHGLNYREYDFRKNSAVSSFIKELSEEENIRLELEAVSYQTLDINGLIRGCSSLEELKAALTNIDSFWKKYYQSSQKKLTDSLNIRKEKDSLMQECSLLKSEKEYLEETLSDLTIQVTRLEKENSYFRSVLKENLYLPVFNEILRQGNLSADTNMTVQPERFDALIEGEIPEPFDGIRYMSEKKQTKAEQLLDSIQNQIISDE